MSVRSEKNNTNQLSASEAMTAAIAEAQPADSHLAEGMSYTTNTPENALHRTIVVSVRASLNELCLQKQKGTWAPSQEALRSILQSKKYTSLDGSAEQQGDLKVCTQSVETLAPPPKTHTFDIRDGSPRLPFSTPFPPIAVDCAPQPRGLARQVDLPGHARCVIASATLE
jgi:hypothetical protein